MKKVVKIMSVVLAILMIAGCFAACGNTEKVTAKVIDIELTEEKYAFGVDKTQPELLEKVNAFIAEIKANGKMDEIFNHYFGDGTPVAITSAVEDSSKDQLVVATNAEFPPFEYTEGEQYLGVDMEIAKLLADYLGKELVIKNMDFEAVCLSVGQQKCDIAMAGLTISPEREENVTFSDSYYQASQKLIVRSDDTKFDECKTADDVLNVLKTFDSKTTIGFQTGTTGQQYSENKGDYESNGLKLSTKPYQSAVLAVQDMLHGNLDYVIVDAAPAASITASINGTK